MKVQCIILNYRTAELTEWALAAARIALEPIEDFQLDIIDNDSQDGSFERLSATVAALEDERIRVTASGRNGGFGAGNNVGIRLGLQAPNPPEYVYILNSDAAPAPDAITALVDFLDARPDVGIAGSYIHGVDDEPHLTAFRFPSVESEILGSTRLGLLSRVWGDHEVPIQPMPSATRQVPWLAGASMMIRTSVLREIGLFDETFFLYFEETDLCQRAARAGWPTWYIVESRVAHVGSASTGMKERERPMPTYWFDSRRHYFVKNHGRGKTWVANVAAAAGLLSFAARAKIQGKPDPNPPRYIRDFLRYNFITNRP